MNQACHLSSAVGRAASQVDVYMAGKFIYWADAAPPGKSSKRGGVRRIKTDGSGMEDVINSGIGSGGIHGVSVDWIARKTLKVDCDGHLTIVL